MNRLPLLIGFTVLLAARPASAPAQSVADRFELGAQIVSLSSSQFDDTDIGFGGRLSWRPFEWIGIEGEFNVYPQGFPDQTPFSRRRHEGLFGATFGVTFDRLRPFARARPGFLDVSDAGAPVACILIFPPPLSCTLASGRTLFAFDVGGGVEFRATPRSLLRVDIGDLLIRYPGTALDTTGAVRDRPFTSHNLRIAAGIGARF